MALEIIEQNGGHVIPILYIEHTTTTIRQTQTSCHLNNKTKLGCIQTALEADFCYNLNVLLHHSETHIKHARQREILRRIFQANALLFPSCMS
jgi:hypothetical protein